MNEQRNAINYRPQPDTSAAELPAFIDVEASGFGRGSYPIEVGLVLGNGDLHCMIIRPESDWQHWDPEAEQLHGISRELLEQHGESCELVADTLNGLLSGKIIYSDGWGNDLSWLSLLFAVAGRSMRFRIDSLRTLLSEDVVACWHQVKSEVIQDYDMRRHRASSDALILQETYRRLLSEASL